MKNMALKRNWFWGASINWTEGHCRLYYLLSFKATISSRTKNKEQWLKRSKAHSIAGIRVSLMARVLNFGSASFKSICPHCFCAVVESSDMNWKLVKKTTNVCSKKTPTIQTLVYLLRSNWNWIYFQNVDSIMQKIRMFSKVARKCISKENKKIGQLHHNESRYFIEDIYQKEVGKAELG